MSENPKRPAFVGPHEGRELELMLAGSKPLSMFVEPLEPEFEYFPEDDFDELVSNGRLLKCVCVENVIEPDGKDGKIRRVIYALPNEYWRVEAILLVQGLYKSFARGWRRDLERVIGLLLGYDRDDIEKYLEWTPARRTLAR